ncbi:PaaX family transcriptional regulator [Nonomuraea deserti]|uniref:PaaX family transcriptional regulator n=1 Tax=Nonomuraea deserti TaxID=1848322 RepID=A0A4V2YBY0_9ACTN|nr:PaaX family transcriptional regulator [Nonomuraea deserti]
MKPRSIVFDLFGDYVRYDDGAAPLQTLTDVLAAFDVPEATTRVVMSRLRKEGWFDTEKQGRSTVYRMTDRSWRLLDEGRKRIFQREREPWDRQWRVVIYHVPETDRGARERVRKKLRWLGFGPLAASTWISPHERLQEVVAGLADEPSVRLDLLTSRSLGAASDVDMAGRCWDLNELHLALLAKRDAYQALLARLTSAPPRGRHALIERTRLVHDYRMLPFDDPDLPLELVPAGWVGRDVHDLFLDLHERLRPEAEQFCASLGIGPLR